MRYAIIENGVVTNVIFADEDFIKEHYANTAMLLKDTDAVEPGAWFDGTNFILPSFEIDPNIIDAEVVEPTKALDAPTE